MLRFAALDFETADHQPDSACALAITRVEDGRVVDTTCRLIRPPRSRVVFTHIHGLRWADLKDHPPFPQVWADLAPLLDGAAFIAAHNAPFDQGVLAACCAAHGLEMPNARFVCTVRLARSLWKLNPARLPDVCRHLCIPLDHHKAESDAEACARIVVSALEDGWKPPRPNGIPS